MCFFWGGQQTKPNHPLTLGNEASSGTFLFGIVRLLLVMPTTLPSSCCDYLLKIQPFIYAEQQNKRPKRQRRERWVGTKGLCASVPPSVSLSLCLSLWMRRVCFSFLLLFFSCSLLAIDQAR